VQGGSEGRFMNGVPKQVSFTPASFMNGYRLPKARIRPFVG